MLEYTPHFVCFDAASTGRAVICSLVVYQFLDRTERNEGAAGGAYLQYALTLDPTVVVEPCETIETDPRS